MNICILGIENKIIIKKGSISIKNTLYEYCNEAGAEYIIIAQNCWYECDNLAIERRTVSTSFIKNFAEQRFAKFFV